MNRGPVGAAYGGPRLDFKRTYIVRTFVPRSRAAYRRPLRQIPDRRPVGPPDRKRHGANTPTSIADGPAPTFTLSTSS